MLVHPQFDPVALRLGPVSIRWYGLMYLAAFVVALLLGRHRIKTRPDLGMTLRDMDDILFYGVLGVILGGRLGYVTFYKLGYYLEHPLEVFAIWQGGMSFHGGFIGVMVALWVFARQRGRSWLSVTDFIAPLCPLGLALGRIGNFINGELPGRPTDLPWGMVFPNLGDNIARHPSQLYQAALEGVALFVIVWLYTRRPRPLGAPSALFLAGYGVFRFAVEFTRQPDDFLGLLALGLSMGQWLSLPMIVIGVAILWRVRSAPSHGAN